MDKLEPDEWKIIGKLVPPDRDRDRFRADWVSPPKRSIGRELRLSAPQFALQFVAHSVLPLLLAVNAV